MNIINIIGRLFRRPHKAQLTQEQISDMLYWANHEWPSPAEALSAGETVWFLGKGKLPTWGTVASLRCTNKGYAFYVINLLGNENKTRGFREGEPLFRHREDVLLWHIGKLWHDISRMYKSLENARENIEYLTAYTERRVRDNKSTISFLENQLVSQPLEDVDWTISNNGEEK